MANLITWLLLAGILIVIARAVWLSRFVFIIRVENGRPRVKQGKVAAPFLQGVSEICRRNGMTEGWIGGVRKGKRVALEFSRGFPPGCRQQLRNEWQASQ